jgi:small subunit ribosomal protein S20
MANTKSAEKSARQSLQRNARNVSVITAIKTRQKKFRATIASGNAEGAKTEFDELSSALDKAAKRGIIHRNVANRRKGRLNKALVAAKSAQAAK